METLTQFLIDWGYWGLFFSALIAGSVVPFSSEAVMLVLVRRLRGIGQYTGRHELLLDRHARQERMDHPAGRKGETAGQGPQVSRRARGDDGLFSFLPTIGEAIAIVLGLMRSNVWLTGGSMLAGKTLRYIVVLATFQGAASLL